MHLVFVLPCTPIDLALSKSIFAPLFSSNSALFNRVGLHLLQGFKGKGQKPHFSATFLEGFPPVQTS